MRRILDAERAATFNAGWLSYSLSLREIADTAGRASGPATVNYGCGISREGRK